MTKKYQDDGIRTCLTETKSWSQLPPPLERHHSAQLVLLQCDHNDDGDDDDAGGDIANMIIGSDDWDRSPSNV